MSELVEFRGSLSREASGPEDFLAGMQARIGEGSEHLVYNEPGFDQIARDGVPSAAVAQKISLKGLAECNMGTPEDNVAEAHGLAGFREYRYRQLRDVFGADIVPDERTDACRLWLSAEEVARFLPAWHGSDGGSFFFTTVTWQDKVWALDWEQSSREDVLELRLPYAERQFEPADADTYAAVNDRLITRATQSGPLTELEIKQFLEVQNSVELKRLLWQVNSDPRIAAAVSRIVKGAVEYGRRHGQGLDFMGKHNAIITKEGQIWLVDVLIPSMVRELDDTPAALAKVATSEGLSRKEVLVLLNGLGFARNMNFLAMWLGLSDRIDLQAVDPGVEGWKMIRRILVASSIGRDLLHGRTVTAG